MGIVSRGGGYLLSLIPRPKFLCSLQGQSIILLKIQCKACKLDPIFVRIRSFLLS
jgi:hypothetical protein